MQAHEDKNAQEKLLVKHFSRFHFLSFTSAMLKCFGDIERSYFHLFWMILHCIAILMDIFSMCVIFYCAGIYAAPAFAMFSFDIIKVNCFSHITPNGLYILAPSKILKFYGFLFRFAMINWKQICMFPGGQQFQYPAKSVCVFERKLCFLGIKSATLENWSFFQLHQHPGHVI